MNGDPHGLRTLEKLSKIPMERIKYVADADAETISSIRRGILLLMAFWSVTAVRSFVALTEVIASLEFENLELVVADVDGSPELYEVPEFNGNVRGNGETAWIRDGKIIATSGSGFNIECYERNTIALLNCE